MKVTSPARLEVVVFADDTSWIIADGEVKNKFNGSAKSHRSALFRNDIHENGCARARASVINMK